MIKTLTKLQELRRKIYVKAKAENAKRFWGLYTHICKQEVLKEAYLSAKRNKGAPGVDGVTFADIEADGIDRYLEVLRTELLSHTYKPGKARKVKIPKADGKSFRELSIPTIRDRIVQGAVKLILEPIFEADFKEGSYGYRPKRQAKEAIERVTTALLAEWKTKVIDLDVSKFFDTVRHDILLRKLALRVQDKEVLHLVKLVLKTTGNRGLPQGGPLSPLLSNVYLHSIDEMLEHTRETTRNKGYTNLSYVRWADDIIILIDHHPRHASLVKVVIDELREELSKLGLELNEQKTKIIDCENSDQSFSFLGFDFRLYKTGKLKRGVRITPKIQSRIKLQGKIKEIFRQQRGRGIQEVVANVNPVLRGWVNYFRIGNSGRSFKILRDWVERKVRRHIYKGKQQRGFGWKRWSKQQLYLYTKLYNDYEIRYGG